MEIKHIEAEDMKREMDEVQQRKYAEYDDLRSNVMSVIITQLPSLITLTYPGWCWISSSAQRQGHR